MQKIYDALPKPYKKGKPVKLDPARQLKYSKLAHQIFECITDHLLNEGRTMHLRNKVILEKITYDNLIHKYMKDGSTIGAESVLKRFREKGFWSRIRCAWTGQID